MCENSNTHCDKCIQNMIERNIIENKFISEDFVKSFIKHVLDVYGLYDELDDLYSSECLGKYLSESFLLLKNDLLEKYKDMRFKLEGSSGWNVHIQMEQVEYIETQLCCNKNNTVDLKKTVDTLRSSKKFFYISYDSDRNVLKIKQKYDGVSGIYRVDSYIFCDIITELGENYFDILREKTKKIKNVITSGGWNSSNGRITRFILLVGKFSSKVMTKKDLIELFKRNDLYIIFADEIC